LAHGTSSAMPPPALLDATVHAALRYVADQATAMGTASAGALALAEATLRAGLPAKAGLFTLTLALASAAAIAGIRSSSPGSDVPRPEADAHPLPLVRPPDRVAGMPDGWYGGSALGGNYEVGLDHVTRHGGRSSGYVLCRQDSRDGFGCLKQAVRADT